MSPSPPPSHILTVFFVARNSSSEYTNLPWVPAGIVIRNVYRSGFGLVRRQTAAIPQTMMINRTPRKTGFLQLVTAFTHSFFFFGVNRSPFSQNRRARRSAGKLLRPAALLRSTAEPPFVRMTMRHPRSRRSARRSHFLRDGCPLRSPAGGNVTPRPLRAYRALPRPPSSGPV